MRGTPHRSLYPHYRDGDANELSDIVFDGVEAHYFDCSIDSNILLDVEEVNAGDIVTDFSELFAAKKNYGWPRIPYTDQADLVRILTARGIKGFEIQASYGLGGWILAARMSQFERQSP